MLADIWTVLSFINRRVLAAQLHWTSDAVNKSLWTLYAILALLRNCKTLYSPKEGIFTRKKRFDVEVVMICNPRNRASSPAVLLDVQSRFQPSVCPSPSLGAAPSLVPYATVHTIALCARRRRASSSDGCAPAPRLHDRARSSECSRLSDHIVHN